MTQSECAYYYFSAVATSRRKMFFNSRPCTTSYERELYISSLPSLPPPCARAALLFVKESTLSRYFHRTAKMSTLYCHHRRIIRDIDTSYFPVGGYTGSGRARDRSNRGRAKSMKRQIHAYARHGVSKELLRVVYSPRSRKAARFT